jgi:hypothetical protein
MVGNPLCFYVTQTFLAWFTKPEYCFPEETPHPSHTRARGQREITFMLHVYFMKLCLNCTSILNEMYHHM